MEPRISPEQPRGLEPDPLTSTTQSELGSRRFAWKSLLICLGLAASGGGGSYFGSEWLNAVYRTSDTTEVTEMLVKGYASSLGATVSLVVGIVIINFVSPFKEEMQKLYAQRLAYHRRVGFRH